jgi:two-component system, NtrC family, nitrogen regulation sensor histidine kinase NtrY
VRIRRRLALYLTAVHLVFALLVAGILVAPALFTASRWWVLGAELLLVGSLVAGARLVRALMVPLETLAQGAQLLGDGDLTTRLRPVGQPEVDALVGVYNGMAETLRAERGLGQERFHLLNQLLAASPSGVVFLDLEGRVAFANPAAGRWLGPAAAGKRPGELDGPVAQALAGLQPEQAEVVVLPGGGRLRCRRGTFMDRGTGRGFFLIEELTEELRQAEKAAYEKLIRMMAHEVNNSVGASNSLLHSCLNYTDLLPEEHRGDFRMALEVVVRRTEQLSALMRGFAEVVRLPTPQKVPTDLVALLEDVAVLMRTAAAERRVSWRWQVDERPAPIPMDRLQMEQVLVNVVKNALEAIGQDGSITVRVGRRGGRSCLTIEDTGPGLTPEARRQLFTPFFTTKEQGQGIGLTLVQQILGQHRFDYALEGPPGGPTRFTIVF